MNDRAAHCSAAALSAPLRAPVLAWGALFLLWVAVAGARAEEYERIKPKEPEKLEPKQEHPPLVPKEPPKEEAAEGEEKVLVAALKGLRFVARTEDVVKDASKYSGVVVEGLPLLDTAEFKDRMAQEFIGKPVTMKVTKRIRRITMWFLVRQGRPLSNAAVPEQDITGGVVQVVVLEGRVAEVKTEGGRWFSASKIRDQVRLQPGDMPNLKRLAEDIDYINHNPFRQVYPAFKPGAAPGATDLVLNIEDRFPVRFYAGYEDTGNQYTGLDRYITGFNWGNAFMQEQELGYQFSADIFTDRYKGHSAYYRVPLPNRHRLEFFGCYAEVSADVKGTILGVEGVDWQASGRYVAPLPRWGDYTHVVQGGFDFKSFNTDLLFGGSNVFNAGCHVAQFVVQYGASINDRFGTLSYTLSGCQPVRLTDKQQAANYKDTRPGADPDYVYGAMALERVWNLPKGMLLVNRFTGQLTSARLVGSEQLGLGGYYNVRGYEERELNADQGFFASVELRSPEFRLGRFMDDRRLENRLHFLAFWDYGYANTKFPREGERDVQELMSVGLGARYRLGTHANLRFDYGLQLNRLQPASTDDIGRIHLGVTVSY